MFIRLMSIFYRLCLTNAPGATFWIRLMVGMVFVLEGLRYLLMPGLHQADSVMPLPLFFPQILTPFLAVLGITCGCMVLVGFFTRLATLPLLTMLCIVLNLTEQPVMASYEAGWRLLYEMRIHYCLLLGTFFVLWAGGGAFSVDAWLTAKRWGANSRKAARSAKTSQKVKKANASSSTMSAPAHQKTPR
jgi:putative oxidoreductase